MKLEKLLNGFEYEIIGNKDVDITTLVYDSRKVEEGSLFVCMVGAAFNAHDFIDQVIEKGAHAIVISQDVPLKEGMTYIKVKDTRIALALLSCAYFNYPSKELKVVGITGTKGKTSSSLMIKSILEHAGKKVGIIGTNGTFIGDIHEPTANTTPESYELQRIMRKMVEHDCEYCVMEVSSQALKMNRVAGIEFDYGVFTNISPDHIGPNEHKDFAEYMACKKHLFDFCQVGLFNKDDEHFEEFTKDVPCKVLTYSIEKDKRLVKFVSKSAFAQGDWMVKVAYKGDYYGIKKQDMLDSIKSNRISVTLLDQNGVKQLAKLMTAHLKTVYLMTDYVSLVDRMLRLGLNNTDMKYHLEYAESNNEFNFWKSADYIIKNTTDIDTAFNQLMAIMGLSVNATAETIQKLNYISKK